jgi:hypothetical protein
MVRHHGLFPKVSRECNTKEIKADNFAEGINCSLFG